MSAFANIGSPPSHSTSTDPDWLSTRLDEVILIDLSSQNKHNDTDQYLRIQAILKEKFTEKFGSLSSCELGKHSISHYFEETRKHLSYYEPFRYLRWENAFNQRMLVSMSPAFHAPCPEGSCDMKYHREIETAMIELFQRQEAIYFEFLRLPLEETHPLQDLRNRCVRVLTMQKGRTILYLRASFHLTQQRAFCDARKSTSDSGLNFYNVYIPPEDCVDIHQFSMKKNHIFNVLHIPIQGMSKLVRVSGELFEGKLSHRELISHKLQKYTYFKVCDFQTGMILGSMSMHKTWKIKTDTQDTIETVNEQTFRRSDQIEPYCLTVTDVMTASSERESDTGGLPILELLTKIAMNVFLNDVFPKIRIKSSGSQGSVFFAAGFRGDFNDAVLNRSFEEARRQGKIFPPFKQLPNLTMWLEKGDFGFSTSVVNRSRGVVQPVLVDFTLEEKKPTWEEKIAQDKPLGRFEGPILPKFNSRDICKYSV